jgi:IPT/TIG domain.
MFTNQTRYSHSRPENESISMLKRTIGIIAAVLVVAYVQTAEAVGPRIFVPLIQMVEVDAVQHRLLISGSNFENSMVTLGGQALAVSKISSNEVVVDLPMDLRPATYLLRVRNNQGLGKASSFHVQIPDARPYTALLESTK